MSFENDITAIRKLLKEGMKATTETMPDTETEPTTVPAPTEKPSRPSTPIKPTPGVTPKPKAFNSDVALFLQRRKLLPESVTEDIHPDKAQWMEEGDEKINQLMPQLSQEQQKYLKTISSESYEETVARVEEYTGIQVKMRNIPRLAAILMETLQKTMAIENRSKQRLEDMALELVFSVPEFKIAEQAYISDEVRIDAKIAQANLQNAMPQQEQEAPEEGLTPDEGLNMKMAEFLQGDDPAEIRRKFANLMITGGSINKLYLFNLIKQKLNAINPDLAKYYGILASVAQIGYWITPFGIEMAAAAGGDTAAGSEEVIPDGDIYIIKARGITFPYLVHELVKGIYEWISLDPSLQGAMAKDTIDDETKDIMAGPGIYKTVASYLPDDKQELLPIVQKKLVAMGPAEIQDVLGKTPSGRKIMAGLISAADREWVDYKQSKEDYEAS